MPSRGHRVSCIICAYNEAPRIAAVLAVASVHPLLGEVIVVDDGSTDGTADIVRRFPSVRLIECVVNGGKSAAMAVGIAAAEHECLMLLDADLNFAANFFDLCGSKPILVVEKPEPFADHFAGGLITSALDFALHKFFEFRRE